MNEKGFTLIELLVVIAILGFLSSIVMASLNQARIKAQEAAIKSSLQSIKTQAELAYSKTGDYSLAEQQIEPFLKNINQNGGVASFTSSYDIYETEKYERYAVSVKFNNALNKYWSISNSDNITVWDTADSTSGPVNYEQAKNICSNAGKRLPSIEELLSLYNSFGTKPPNFSDTEGYWSINILNGVPELAWVAFMYEGSFWSGFVENDIFLVRCVK